MHVCARAYAHVYMYLCVYGRVSVSCVCVFGVGVVVRAVIVVERARLFAVLVALPEPRRVSRISRACPTGGGGAQTNT